VETEGTHAGGIIGSDFERMAAQQTPLDRSVNRATSHRLLCFWHPMARWVTGETLFVSGGL
jgi:3-oxoacyl-[acyl-carrier protein] reductase